MSPSLLIVATSKDGEETIWLVDEFKKLPDGERELWRSGEHVITLGADDYANGWADQPWSGEIIGLPDGDAIEDVDGVSVFH
ncbi:hypothetical protein [Roseibium sp.]|uniref:hypothetical protein n=1 Tax=Roseibium sp. TaxID=1936156 RepID=UPI003B524A87